MASEQDMFYTALVSELELFQQVDFGSGRMDILDILDILDKPDILDMLPPPDILGILPSPEILGILDILPSPGILGIPDILPSPDKRDMVLLPGMELASDS